MKFRDLLDGNSVDIEETVFTIENLDSPIIVSIPHSSRFVLDKFFTYRNFDVDILQDTDIGTEELFNFDFGSQVIGFCNPYFVNYSRDRNSFDQIRGVFPTLFLDGRDIKLKEYLPSEIDEILTKFYDEYHKQLRELIKKVKSHFGFAIIIDGHGMAKNSIVDGSERPDFNFGTLDGKTILPDMKEFIDKYFEKNSNKFSYEFDRPYKGGYITQHYYDLSENIFVMQIETAKENYILNNLKDNYEFSSNFPEFKHFLEELILELSEFVLDKYSD